MYTHTYVHTYQCFYPLICSYMQMYTHTYVYTYQCFSVYMQVYMYFVCVCSHTAFVAGDLAADLTSLQSHQETRAAEKRCECLKTPCGVHTHVHVYIRALRVVCFFDSPLCTYTYTYMHTCWKVICSMHDAAMYIHT